jgi:hypothetical protein
MSELGEGRGGQETVMGGKYNKTMLYPCMKMSQ